MSSGSFATSQGCDLFTAPAGVSLDAYVVVTYLVGSSRSGDETALAMAMEQSAATVFIPDYQLSDELSSYTARVVSVEELAVDGTMEAVGYDLHTEVYQVGSAQQPGAFRVQLAFPQKLLLDSPSQWLNVLVGEIPRLGFITSLRIENIEMRSTASQGPAFGVRGLRQLLGVERAPILCRSTRPAVGLDLETLRKINTDVLTNGFHAVKDDELQAWEDVDSYTKHVEAMVTARKHAEDATGEKKFYIANLLCDGWNIERRLEIACTAGADGLLVAPAIQGLSVLPWVKKKSDLPILAHNTASEMFTRHPAWSLTPAFYLKLQRYFGAEWVVTTGGFSEKDSNLPESKSVIDAAQGAAGELKPSMLILQGGKNPDALPTYVEAAAGTDFMLIVASWVDGHPEGLPAAARIFRARVDGWQ